jgi:hypothetical protein
MATTTNNTTTKVRPRKGNRKVGRNGGLTSRQYMCLYSLSSGGNHPTTIRQLRCATGHTRGWRHLLQTLVGKGYVQQHCPGGQRTALYSVTPAGLLAFNQAHAQAQAYAATPQAQAAGALRWQQHLALAATWGNGGQ